MSDLKVTIVQSRLFWEQIDNNLLHFDKLLFPLKRNSTDLIVLPEMFSTGFSMNAQTFAEDKNGKAMQWMKKISHQKNAVVCGSLMTKDKDKFYNRLIWMKPDGSYEYYDKRHLFTMGQEPNNYTAGTKKIVVDLKGWKISPLVCYDLRFPVWSRNVKTKNEFDLLLYVANWPERRKYAWQQLLSARAIENVSFVVGVNRIGKDGNGMNHTGNSAVIDFMGTKISQTKPSKQSVETIVLSKKELEKFRKDFPVLNDADEFKLK